MIGQTVSHYRIIRKIGEGGMGAVYEAKDLKLPRSVALKFLRQSSASMPSAETRFLQEARIVSTLEHPNIAAIFDIDETDDGDVFIVMPFYDGRTLDAILKDGSLSLENAIDIVCQVGRGLAKAHEKGIVHRDIKPANIIVTSDGTAKVLDFGLATLTGETRLTHEGGLVGTAVYMSPQQATGDDIDHRTDIWSLGVVLYELMTGFRPFRGKAMQAVMYSIIHDDPEDITTYRDDIPPGVVEAIRIVLQKNPDDRYLKIGDFVGALEAVQEGKTAEYIPASSTDEISIAVLPFDDLSPGKDHEYLSDGLTEDVITDLAKIAALRVISRNSALRLKGTDQDIRAISRSLKVNYVLRGSVRRAKDDLRISVQLIDARRDKTLWAEKFSGSLDDIFDMQEKVARSIVEALQLKLTPLESRQVARRPIEDARAYEYYLRARKEIFGVRLEGLQQALEFLQSGLEIVGDNVLLFSALAHVHFQFLNTGLGGPEHLERAEHYVDRVLALEPESAHGHRLRGLIEFLRHKFARAAMEFTQALVIDRNDPDSLFWLIHIYLCSGQMQAASVCIEELLRIDPLTPINWAGPAWVHFFEGRFNAAVRAIREVYEKAPDDIAFRYQYFQMLVYSRHIEQAFSIVDALLKDLPEHPLAVLCLLLKFALQGDQTAFDQTLTPELTGIARTDPFYTWFVATALATLDRREAALDWLEHAAQSGFINYPFLAEHDHLLSNLRREPRFDTILGRVKSSWEAFSKQIALTVSHLMR